MSFTFILNIIGYLALLFVMVYIILEKEKVDLWCPTGTNKFKQPLCKDGNGKFHSENKPTPQDSVDTSLNKIANLSKIDLQTVKWRRIMILSFISAIFISLLVFRKLFPFPKFLLIMLLIFLPFYTSISFFNFHHSKFSAQYIEENIQQIKNTLNGKTN